MIVSASLQIRPIAIARPETLNAAAQLRSDALVKHIESIEDDLGVRVIMLTGDSEKAVRCGYGICCFTKTRPLETLQSNRGRRRGWRFAFAVRPSQSALGRGLVSPVEPGQLLSRAEATALNADRPLRTI